MLVRYYGHVGLPTGYGDAANEICMAMLEVGIELEISTDGDQLPARYLPLATHIKNEGELSPDPDVVIVHTLPLDCAKVLAASRVREFYPRAACIAYTTWEGIAAPKSVTDALSVFHQVWVPSQQTRDAIGKGPRAGGGGVAWCAVVPHAYDPSTEEDRYDVHPPYYLPEAPGTYRFYTLGAWVTRKNIDCVVRAYLRAFTPADDVELVVQSAGADRTACLFSQISTGLTLAETPKVTFSHERISEEQIWSIHRECDCYVTATRGEAWNLPAFDAMLAGRHIIAPSEMGHDDFLGKTSAWLYWSRTVASGGEIRLSQDPKAPTGTVLARYVGTQGITVRTEWRDPEVMRLAALMRSAYDQRLSHLTVNYNPSDLFSREAVGETIRNLLKGTTLV